MKLHLSRLALAAAALACAGATHAVVLTFDGLAPSPLAPTMPLLGHNDEFYEAGFWIDPFSNDANAQNGDLVGAIVDGADVANTCVNVACPTNNATNFLAGLNDGAFAIGSIANLPFTVQSLSASYLGAAGAVQPTTAGLLRIQGITLGNTSITETFNLPARTLAASTRSTPTR